MSKIETRSYLGKDEIYRIVRAEDVILTDLHNDTLDKELKYIESEAYDHYNNTTNPHNVTKTQVGLGYVDNTADVDKKVFSATQLATSRKIGNADFNGTKDISLAEIGTIPAAAFYNHTGNENNPHKVTKAQVGLGNADNTADNVKNVLSATKLTNARNINGTSFNGTANITTALWGTARTVTIGDSAKSINGSANVSFTLAEIGVPSLDSFNDHLNNKSNPHAVTKAQVGLGNADNIADANKNVLSATKLTTARTINGTSFNGTASIVTSYWGTSRTITIGKSGKLINGSTDVIFGLDEIGAATQVDFSAHLNNKSNPHAVTKAQVGLGNADNTADSAKKVLSATKLTTARTINGTSFDGSANIVTAKWGTSRTIELSGAITGSIGIDGSGDVTMTTEEGDVSFKRMGQIDALTDFNTASTPGCYKVQIGGGDIKFGDPAIYHGPNEYHPDIYPYGLLLVFKSNVKIEDRITQIYIPNKYENVESAIVCIRTRNQDKWQSWSPIFRGITKKYIGLGNVDNTTDSAKNVLSATKLTTARTINGTSFNGTANIVTANWGTARTFTIGNTGKSVNGAGNVAWTLAEIGAAAATDVTAHIGNKSNPHAVTKAQVGLGSVDNTADSAKNVLSATMLTTARTINGTSFNGTANITTANWGTARTFTIGNSSKSVNGAGNVAWTLAEIGAAPAGGSTSISKLAATVTLGNGDSGCIEQNGATYRQRFEIKDNSTPNDEVFVFSQSSDSGVSYKKLMEIRDDGNVIANKFTGELDGNAKTASSLAKATNINGTLFNNTTDIVTEKWGKSRAITIGNTKKTIDGSGDISWSIAEIGGTPLTTFNSHLNNKSNPHAVTKAQVGLGSVDNTSDINKPISSATQTALDSKVDKVNGQGLSDCNYTLSEKNKLSKIEAEANKYIHPTTHPASMIVQDATHRFVTDTEKATYLDKYTKAEIDNKFSAQATGNDWKESVATYADIAKSYPKPDDGWTVNVKDTDITYRYNGTTWIAISANSIPIATESLDGKMSKELVKKLGTIEEGANKYIHPGSGTNPHGTTKADVGLGSADNTADSAKNVLSATKLTTARTINGTSFNGTANITTANWGTARSFTIGDSVKSVNGSANMSWTLAEIGAAAATDVTAHIGNKSNPHAVTKAQVGLGSVDNTADAAKNVLSATKLTTARTINGTSFNGTANITTANWGTARTFTIGNSSKSVNGAANIGFTLAEIGAAAATDVSSHIGNKSNPHAVTKAQVGLGNVDNTADSAKNVLSATKLTTARTINGVSFDGTANINIVAKPEYVQLTTQDLNTVLTFGNYYAIGGNAVVNKPTGEDAFNLEVKRAADNYITQILIAANKSAGKIYQRQTPDYGKTWTSWTYIYSQLYKPSKADVGLGSADNTADSAKNVLSATKLTTARTINGTSFNGTANIVTANWGTARTITIGSAGKSINGSANVAWTLAEIGVPSLTSFNAHLNNKSNPHAVTKAQVGLGSVDNTADSVKNVLSATKSPLLSNLFESRPTDANIPTSANGSGGLSTFKATTSMTANKPASDGHILHMFWDNANGFDSQILIPVRAGESGKSMQYRGQSEKTWGAWKTLLDSSNYTAYTVNKTGAGASGTWGINVTGSAAKLTTPRAINGTNFDGSAAITTAKWGTARTITLSGTVTGSVSMDGSGNATLKTTEGDVSFKRMGEIGNTIDWNTLTDPGCYKIQIPSWGAADTMHSPNEYRNMYSYGLLLVFKSAVALENRTVQIYIPHNMNASSAVIVFRMLNGSTNTAWTAWGPIFKNVSKSDVGLGSVDNTADSAKNVLSATKWTTARTITIGNTGKSVNGTANVAWTLAEIGAAAASHTHAYLPLSGGNMTGPIKSSFSTSTWLNGNQGNALLSSTVGGGSYVALVRYPSTNGVFCISGWNSTLLATYTSKTLIDAGTNSSSKQLTILDESGNSVFPGNVTAGSFTGPLTGAVNGNASSASKLATPRTINGTNFDGSAAITTANWGTARTITIGATGKSVNGSANMSWTLAELGLGNVNNTSDASKNVLSATKFTTARTINGTSFNGTANITTAFWGSSRLLTVGASSKPVNGSADVTWSLAEIGALPLTGGTVTGKTFLKEGYNVITHMKNDGTAGYIMVAQIKITSTYANSPVEFKIMNRNAVAAMYVSILFTAVNGTDPGLNSFIYRGYNRYAYIVKSATSTWDLYVKKSEPYDRIVITDIDRDLVYTSNNIAISYPGTFVETLPEGYIAATRFDQASTATKLETPRKIGNATFDGTKDITLAEIGAATTDANLIMNAIQGKMIDLFYPIGSIKMSFENVNPGTYLTGTTWELTSKGAYIRGVDTGDASLSTAKTGGSNTIDLSHNHAIAAHTHTTPNHTHTIASHTHTIAHAHSINGHSHTVNSHAHSTAGLTLTVNQIPSHSHAMIYYWNDGSTIGQSYPWGLDTNKAVRYEYFKHMTGNAGGGASHAHGNTGASAPGTNAVALNTNSGGGNSGGTALTTASGGGATTGGTALTTGTWAPSRTIEPVYQTLFVWKRTK